MSLNDSHLIGLLSRSVVMINEYRIVIHTEQVTNKTDEPDYLAATAVS